MDAAPGIFFFETARVQHRIGFWVPAIGTVSWQIKGGGELFFEDFRTKQ
jgi:hypothetical protein